MNDSQKIEESNKINIEQVKFTKKWSFWETYESREKNKDQNYMLKKIFDFDNIIAFWQFWNKYPGSDPFKIFYSDGEIKYFFEEEYRISSMNFFLNGISPEWEDSNNRGGSTITMEFSVERGFESFREVAKKNWERLVLSALGNTLPAHEFVNGVRFVDKTNPGKHKKIMFRFEVWVSKGGSEKVNELKEYLKETYGDKGITVKPIT